MMHIVVVKPPPTTTNPVALSADSGPLYRTGALVIEGLQRHDERSVRNLAEFAPGTPVTEALLLDYQERLQRAGLFERVSVTLTAEPERAAAAPIVVRVGELPVHEPALAAPRLDLGCEWIF